MLIATMALCLPALAQQRKGEVFGTATANIRGGAGIEHPIIITLKEGEPLTIEGQTADWYQVTATGGQKGFVHRNLIKVIADPPPAVATKIETAATPESLAPSTEAKTTTAASPTEKEPVVEAPAVPAESVVEEKVRNPETQPIPVQPAAMPVQENQKVADDRAPSVLQLLEGREGDMQLWAAIAVAFFIIGWICGGNYYLRRERRRRGRLSF